MAGAYGVVIRFPRWRCARRTSDVLIGILAELEALDRAEARLLWACFAAALCVLGSLEALTLG
jgi:hypothetical protein